MSGLLLDTHVWLWYAEGVAGQLRPTTVSKLDAARRVGGLVVSAISVWEIGMLCARGRVQLAMPLRDWVSRALEAPGMRFAPLDTAVAVESTLLPGDPPGDPADRFLVATARDLGLALVTRDERILRYARDGALRVLAA